MLIACVICFLIAIICMWVIINLLVGQVLDLQDRLSTLRIDFDKLHCYVFYDSKEEIVESNITNI